MVYIEKSTLVKDYSMTIFCLSNIRIVTLPLIIVITITKVWAMPPKHNAVTSIWETTYVDDYDYATSTAKFNTWFWREDSVGTHTFNVTNVPTANCTTATPCVKLTSQRFPNAVDYINAEMYNNSCVKGQGSVWSNYTQEDYSSYVIQCGKPYPYRPIEHPGVSGVVDSWNTSTTGAVSLWKNPLDTSNGKACVGEPCWEWYRDLVFNVPYLATSTQALKISMGITAEGKAGGSRGWGIWNTTMSPAYMQMAWFMEISTQNASGGDVVSSVLLMTIGKSPSNDEKGICVSTLDSSIDIYDYHSYSIEWQHDALTYFVDGNAVAQHTTYVPNRGLPFHNWADNRNYVTGKPANYGLFTDKTNYINAYVVQQATSPPAVSPPAGNNPVCTSYSEIEKRIEKIIEKDILAAIVAWIIEHELMPGPVILGDSGS